MYTERNGTYPEGSLKVLSQLQDAGVVLSDKHEFSKNWIKFPGQIIEALQTLTVRAVRAMEKTRYVSRVRQFLGMANHLGKVLPHLADKTQPFRDLLKKSNTWAWGCSNSKPLIDTKADLTTPPGLILLTQPSPLIHLYMRWGLCFFSSKQA